MFYAVEIHSREMATIAIPFTEAANDDQVASITITGTAAAKLVEIFRCLPYAKLHLLWQREKDGAIELEAASFNSHEDEAVKRFRLDGELARGIVFSIKDAITYGMAHGGIVPYSRTVH